MLRWDTFKQFPVRLKNLLRVYIQTMTALRLVLLAGGEATWAEADAVRVAAQLHRSLSETGLALLVNHGVAEDKVSTVEYGRALASQGPGWRVTGLYLAPQLTATGCAAERGADSPWASRPRRPC